MSASRDTPTVVASNSSAEMSPKRIRWRLSSGRNTRIFRMQRGQSPSDGSAQTPRASVQGRCGRPQIVRSLLGCLGGPGSCPEAGELQFFLVRGGYEGFLSQHVKLVDANRVAWESRSGTTDINDALVVLDTNGNYVGAFQFAVPNYYPRTAQMVASDWNGRAVFSYYNKKYSYFGLAVLDQGKLPRYDPKIKKYRYWIDIHHKFATAGCIEIAGSSSPKESNFDSFVAKITKRFGHCLEETFVADKNGYSEVELVPTDAKANAFSVNMTSYLGRIFVVDIPAG
jgi:hypothetical protein